MRVTAGLATILVVLLSGTTLSCTIEPRSSTPRVEASMETADSPPLRWSMEKWREAHEEAEAAMLAPMGDKRIARCEEFLSKYPDYPEADFVLRDLVDASLAKGKPDFVRLDGLLQQMLARTKNYSPDWILDGFYLEHGFPPEMSERVVAKVREAIAKARADLASETDPDRRRDGERRLQAREVSASISEGRILLAKGDPAGAIRKLLEAESADARVGTASLTLVNPAGAVAMTLPNGMISSDRLNLALATAYARSGRRDEAFARLERVRNNLGAFYTDVTRGVEAMRKELPLQGPPVREVRAAPEPSRDFRFKDLQGRQVALSDFRGRVVLAMFWSTW